MNDIAGTIEANRARNDQWLAALKEESARKPSAYKELREIRDREDYDRASRRMQQRDNIEAAIGATPEGGRLSDAQVKSLNEMRGVKIGGDGLSEGQIVGGGYNTETGGYEFVIAGKNPDGTIAPQKTEIPETELYGMMRNRPDWFTPEHIGRVEQSIWGKDKSYTRDRFEGLSKRYVAHRSAIQGDIDRTKEAMRIGRNGGGSGYGVEIAKMNNDARMERLREQESGRDARAKARIESREEIEAARDARLREAEWNRYANKMREFGRSEEEIAAILGQKPSVQPATGGAQSGASKADVIVGAGPSVGAQVPANANVRTAGIDVNESAASKSGSGERDTYKKGDLAVSRIKDGGIAIYKKGADGYTLGTFKAKPGEPIKMNGQTLYWGGKGEDDLYTEQEWKVERTKEAARKIIEERKRKAASGANDKNSVVANGDDPMWGEGDGEKKKTAVQLRQENAAGYDKNKKTVEAKARDAAMESAFQDHFKTMKDAGLIGLNVTEEEARKQYFDTENKRRRIKDGIRKELMRGYGDRRTGL